MKRIQVATDIRLVNALVKSGRISSDSKNLQVKDDLYPGLAIKVVAQMKDSDNWVVETIEDGVTIAKFVDDNHDLTVTISLANASIEAEIKT